jgi:hypothetical protein
VGLAELSKRRLCCSMGSSSSSPAMWERDCPRGDGLSNGEVLLLDLVLVLFRIYFGQSQIQLLDVRYDRELNNYTTLETHACVL